MKNDIKFPNPPMGWNSYDYYDTCIKEDEVKKNADYMAKYLKDYGWQYIIVDIQWYAQEAGKNREFYEYVPFGKLEMDSYGRLIPCKERFPSAQKNGFQKLADYIHSLGLKFGIHIMRGIPRCAAELRLPIWGSSYYAHEAADPYAICNWNPDMYGVCDNEAGQAYYDSIITLYAQWGVDYIKCDDICNTHGQMGRPDSAMHEIIMIYNAIKKCKREIFFSVSPGPALLNRAYIYNQYTDAWRMSNDFWDNWEQLKNMFDFCEQWGEFTGQGKYPDCDMLPLGKIGKGFGRERNTFLNRDEQRTMFTLWSIFRSPMMLGCELTMLDPETLQMLQNRKVLKMLTTGFHRYEIYRNSNIVVWVSENEGSKEIFWAIFNLSDNDMSIKGKELLQIMELENNSKVKFENIWKECFSEIENNENIAEKIPAHGVVLLYLDEVGSGCLH